MSNTFERQSITEDLARRVIDACVAKARETERRFCVAVVDESGVLKAFARMDGAPLVSIQISQDKAYTAAGFGIPTHAWFDFVKDDPPLSLGAPTGIDRLVLFGGGFPIMEGDALIGGLGVSGGHYSEDMSIAEAGLAVLGS